MPGARPPVPEMSRYTAVRMSWQDHHRRLDGPFRDAQFNHVSSPEAEPLSHRGRDECGIIPSELGKGLWQLLKPAIISPAPISDRRIRPEEKVVLAFFQFHG